MKIKAYHGTEANKRDFNETASKGIGSSFGGGITYFVTTLEAAKKYAVLLSKHSGSKTRVIYEVELDLQKTFPYFDYDNPQDNRKQLEAEGYDSLRYDGRKRKKFPVPIDHYVYNVYKADRIKVIKIHPA